MEATIPTGRRCYNDCILLEKTFPDLFDGFMNGDFTVKQGKRKCSAIPVDQALEKEYNKNAKGKGSIIGFTREKEVVAKWNIIKHEKMQYFKFLNDLCNLSVDSEYSLHHEYLPTTIAEDWVHVTDIYSYIKERTNLFSSAENQNILNIATGVLIDGKEKDMFLECISNGDKAYNDCVKSRLESHQKQLFDVIPKTMNKTILSTKKKCRCPPGDHKSHFCQKVQGMILNLAIDSQRINIVFDIYLKNSIKASAQKSRKKSIEPVPVSINRDDQQLPSAIGSFWASELNKEALQMHYIKCVSAKYTGEKPLYLGESLTGDIFGFGYNCKQ